MGIFERTELSCEECLWGGQCPAEYICDDFDPIDEAEGTEPPDRGVFEKEYLEYCTNRQGPREKIINFGARPLSSVCCTFEGVE